MVVNQINDAGRADEGILARWFKDINGTLTTAGTGAAYTLILNRTGVTAVSQIGTVVARAHVANTGACTVQFGALAAKPIRKSNNAALVVGDIMTNDVIMLAYNTANDTFQLVGK